MPPDDSKQLLSRALNSWKSWQLPFDRQPQVISRLTGGTTNSTYLVGDGQNTVVLRINSRFSDLLGIDRQTEKDVLEKVSKAGFAPQVFFNNLQWLVTEYVPEKPSLQGNAFLEAYTQLINSVHQLSFQGSTFDYVTHCERYWRFLVDQQVTIPEQLCLVRNNILLRLEQLQGLQTSRVLCHHDAGTHNLLQVNNRLLLIDWEYAGLGIRDIDLASGGILCSDRADLIEVCQYINQLWYLVYHRLTSKPG